MREYRSGTRVADAYRMHAFPHHYFVTTTARPEVDTISVRSDGLPDLTTATPVEFDGPGGRWSPETLLVAAVADCFALTFRGIAKMSKLPWLSLDCDAAGTLERPERVTRFTQFTIHARLKIPEGANADQARRILTRAEETCLITRSLTAQTHLDLEIETVPVPVHMA